MDLLSSSLVVWQCGIWFEKHRRPWLTEIPVFTYFWQRSNDHLEPWTDTLFANNKAVPRPWIDMTFVVFWLCIGRFGITDTTWPLSVSLQASMASCTGRFDGCTNRKWCCFCLFWLQSSHNQAQPTIECSPLHSEGAPNCGCSFSIHLRIGNTYLSPLAECHKPDHIVYPTGQQENALYAALPGVVSLRNKKRVWQTVNNLVRSGIGSPLGPRDERKGVLKAEGQGLVKRTVVK